MSAKETKNMLGKRYGKLVALKRAGSSKRGHAMWLFKCDCGVKKVIRGSHIRLGKTVSCGCSKGRRHDMCKEKIYMIWGGMIQRCNNKNSDAYHFYGKRGIKVSKKWHNFINFYADMGKMYAEHIKKFGIKDTQLDRIDNDGGYWRNNCRWVTQIEQANNRRNNKFLEYGGKSRTISQWAREKNMCDGTLRSRLKYGWSVSKALSLPVKAGKGRL